MQISKYDAPWEQIDWPPAQQQRMLVGWAEFCNKKGRSEQALKYLDRAYDLDPMDAKVLYNRSVCKRDLVRSLDAFTDAKEALNLMPTKEQMLRETVTATYEMNEFEDAKRRVHDARRMTICQKRRERFKNTEDVLDGNLKDCLGDSLLDFFSRNEKILKATNDGIAKQKHHDPRPLWKILREMDKCDVKSTVEKIEVLVPPLEVARRERARILFNQNCCTGRAWKDVEFLNKLRIHPCLDLPHNQFMRTQLKSMTEDAHRMVMKSLRMLHARSPLYNERWRKCAGHNLCEEARNKNLFHIQYQTRRNMITVLRSARYMRAVGSIVKLENYVEEVMGEYVVLKTDRVMPWKFEFINEMYNILALAYSDAYQPPAENDKPKMRTVKELLNVSKGKSSMQYRTFVFGDRTTHTDPMAHDLSLANFKRNVARYEKRLLIAKYPIERAYLRYSIAKAQFTEDHFDECCQTARKALEEAKAASSLLWQFLTVVLVAKAQSKRKRVERVQDALEEAYMLARRIRSYQLCKFVQVCSRANTLELVRMKLSRSYEARKKHRDRSKFHLLDASISSIQSHTPSEEIN